MLGSNRKRIHILRVKEDHTARPCVGSCALAIVGSIAESQVKGVGTRRGGELGSLTQLTMSTCHPPGGNTGGPELNKPSAWPLGSS